MMVQARRFALGGGPRHFCKQLVQRRHVQHGVGQQVTITPLKNVFLFNSFRSGLGLRTRWRAFASALGDRSLQGGSPVMTAGETSTSGLMAELAGLARQGDAFVANPSPDWRLGRTLAGGLSAAFCVAAAETQLPWLPPLRSALFSFAGPLDGAVTVLPRLIRRGRSSAFVGVEVCCATGVGVCALLTFAEARASGVAYEGVRLRPPPARPPDECPPFHVGWRAPFAKFYDMRLAGGVRPHSGADLPEFLVWLRPLGVQGGILALLAAADAPPPPVGTMLSESVRLGTMTWSLDVTGDPSRFDWLLLESRGEHVGAGYATHTLRIWNEQGHVLASGRQTAAVFA